MDLGMIGLGRMGANLVRRLLRDGHRAVVYDVDLASVAALVSMGLVFRCKPRSRDQAW
jgi:6-phosphogluconate dehydrogenase